MPEFNLFFGLNKFWTWVFKLMLTRSILGYLAVKLKIPGKAFLKSDSRTSVTFKLWFLTLAIYQCHRLGLNKCATMQNCEKYKKW